MDNFLIDNIIDKVEGQQKRLDQTERSIGEIENNLSEISDQSNNLKKLSEVVGQIQERMKTIVWPVEKMNELSIRLKLNNDLLSSPVKTKTTIVHTAGKLGWFILFLSCTIVLLAFSLFETVEKLDQYKKNDLLWRFVKIVNKDQNLEYLHSVEKLYLQDPEKMKSRTEEEELYQKQQFEIKATIPLQIDTSPNHSKHIEKRK